MKLLAMLGRHRTLLLFVGALSLGGLAAFGARGYIAEQLAIERERLVPRQAMVQLVVAKQDLPRGAPVSAESMAVRELPREYAPAGAVTPERFDAVAGGVLAQPMSAGEPLLASLVAMQEASGFSSRVRAGIRALTIAVDEVNAISGMLQPGDRIDLMLSVRLPAGNTSPMPQEVTRTLMQDVRVLATGRQARPGGDDRQPRNFNAITIEVTPEQAQKLVVAQRNGKLTALLRNPGDRETAPARMMDVYGLLDIPAAATPVVGLARTEVIVGGVGAAGGAPRGVEPAARLAANGSVALPASAPSQSPPSQSPPPPQVRSSHPTASAPEPSPATAPAAPAERGH